VLVVAVIVVLTIMLPTRELAETTAAGTLFAFSFVNLALWRMKGRADYRSGGFSVPRVVPLLGAVLSMSFLINEMIRRAL